MGVYGQDQRLPCMPAYVQRHLHYGGVREQTFAAREGRAYLVSKWLAHWTSVCMEWVGNMVSIKVRFIFVLWVSLS